MADGNLGTLYYEIEADTSKLLGSTSSVDASLGKLDKQFKRTDKAANEAQFTMTKTAAAVKSLGGETDKASSQLSNFTKIFGGFLGLQGANALIKMADSYNEYAERISMATSSTEEYELVQKRLLATANGTYRAMSEAQEVYIQTADSLRSLGYSTDQVLDITDSLSYAFVKNVTSVDRAQGAINAFTKAINKGKVDAMGWQTILAAVPTVVDDIAKASGNTAAEIRQMGFAGELSAQMLNEGLRKSLDANKDAADGMATTVADAFTALRNNLAAYVGEANRSSGATSILSGAIVKVAENIDTLAKLLLAAGAGAMAKYIAQTGASIVSTMQASLAVRARAAEELNLARAHATQAAAASAAATANAGLTASHAAATTASIAHASAQTRLAAAKTAARAASVGLLGVLGGPVGIIALAASAAAGIALFGSSSRKAASDVDVLTISIKELGAAQLKEARNKAVDQLNDLEEATRSAARGYSTMYENVRKLPDGRNVKEYTRRMDQHADTLETNSQKMAKLKERIKEIDSASSDLIKTQQAAANSSPGAQSDPEVEKRLEQMREELELVKLTGAARARLQAIYKLGANATAEERAEAERLATEIYRLESARKGSTKANKESAKAEREAAKALKDTAKAAEDNKQAIADIAQELMYAGMGAKELAEAKMLASLNAFATPDDVKMVKELAAALWEASAASGRRSEFGDDPASHILGARPDLAGNANPYEDERAAEEQRYAEQRDRLIRARQEGLEIGEEFNGLEQQMAQEHADKMAEIKQAESQMLMHAAGAGFAGIADLMRTFQGEQSSAYKAMFAVSKAFAVADATVQAYSAISKAWASAPWPANLAAVAATTPQVMGVVSAISGTSYGGGRQYGGPVSAGSMHRINENGAPEILNTASGQQYLLPNSRGQVVSNKDALASGGAPGVTVILNEDASRGGEVQQSQGADREQVINIFVADIRGGGKASRALEGTYGMRRQGS